MNPPIEKEPLHHRSIGLCFYRRSDGLYEVQGRLEDSKTHPFRRQLANEDTPPGTLVHDITVTLIIDEDLLIHNATAHMAATPFQVCLGAQDTLAPLKGLHIGRGWTRQVRELLGGAASCTHIVELLGPIATTAFQGLAPQRLARINEPGSEAQRRAKVDSCYAYDAHREVVKQLWPELHMPPSSTE